MPKENSVLTIDVGGDNLKMAEFVFPPGGAIVLKKFAFRKLEEKDGDNGAFEQAYKEMLSQHNFTSRDVRLSLSSHNSIIRLIKLPSLVGNKSAINRLVEYQARQNVPCPMNEVVWDYQLIRHAWQDQRSELLEDGSTLEISEDHEEYEALFIAVRNELIERYTDVIEDSGKKILTVEIAPVALFNAAKATQCRDDECALILNVGGRNSNLLVADQNRALLRSIPIGGDTVTQQVAKEFGISFEDAEDLKHRHGFVALGGAYEEPESEVAATISKIARNVMTRLHAEVNRTVNVWRSQHGGHQPTRLLLSGGGSTMPYITDFFNEKMRLPVEYLNTFSAITISEDVNKEELQLIAPMFQEMIGMSLRSVTQCPIDVSLIPPSIRKQRDLNKKKPYFYLSAASLLVCLSIFAYGVNKRLAFDRERVSRVQEKVNEIKQVERRVDGLVGQLNSAKSAYNDPMQFLNDRNKWTGMLTELEQLMPDLMWLTTLEGVGDEIEGLLDSTPSFDDNPFGNPFGDPFGGDPFGSRSTGPQRPASPADIREVKQLRLVGYTLINDRNLIEQEFQQRLKSSTFFENGDEGSVLVKYTPETDALNLSSFEVLVKLKEPITK